MKYSLQKKSNFNICKLINNIKKKINYLIIFKIEIYKK